MVRFIWALIVAVALFNYCNCSYLLAEEAVQNEEEVTEESATESENKKAKSSSIKSDSAESERKTYEVRPQRIKIEETLEGVFVSEMMEEISLQPEEWTSFKIEEVVEHGAKVQEGETLIKFQSEDLLEEIADLELELHLSEQRLIRAEEELPQKKRSWQRQLAKSQESLQRTEEDYRRYKETEREQEIDSADMRLKGDKFYLDYSREELEQLEKMYEADDLTEETEEIVLRRQRFYVERAEFNYKLSQYNHKKTLAVIIPRRDYDIEQALDTAKHQLKQAQTANQYDANIARYELEKQKRERKKSIERHVHLLADKDLLAVRSPAAGIVYYGQAVDGKWSAFAEMRKKLLPGKNADKDTVLMTVVDPDVLYFLANFDQKLLISIREGQTMKVQPTVEGSKKLAASVTELSTVPVADDDFAVKIEVSEELPKWMVPGLTGKATIVTYEKDDALLVPADAVQKDEITDEQYVWLVRDDDVKKTVVETGKKKGSHVEITSGLKEGDRISLEDEAEGSE